MVKLRDGSYEPKVRGKVRKAKQSTVDYVCDAIIKRIEAGRYDAGEHLTEGRLIAELGSSRGSLRQAFDRLAALGMLQLLPNRGASVPRLTRQDLSDFMQLRAVHESFATRRAAERIDEPGCRDRL